MPVGTHATDRRRGGGDEAIVAAGVVLSATAAAITAAGSSAEHVWLEACARALMVGAPIGVGVYARGRPGSARFGTLLVITGAAWFLTTLAEASDPWLHALGRTAGWLCEPLLMYLVLAFPTGRLHSRFDRAFVGVVALVALVFYLGSLPLVERFAEPSPWSTCSAGCPGNPLQVARRGARLVHRRRAPAARVARRAAVRDGVRAAGDAAGRLQHAGAARASRRCWSWRSRASRCTPPRSCCARSTPTRSCSPPRCGRSRSRCR